MPARLALTAVLPFALAALSQAADDTEYRFADEFRAYAQSSDASPVWETGMFGWRVRGGAFAYEAAQKDFAVVAAAPAGGEVTVEAEMRLRAATGRDWKIAGVAVRADERNFWHLALVEGPDADGKRHFVELSEMLDGRWLAHTGGDTRLAQTASTGGDFDWSYDRVYRMRIELTPQGIVGTVSEADGAERARIGYAFGAKAVAAGVPALTTSGFRTEFTKFSTRVARQVKLDREETAAPPFVAREHGSRRGTKTGFFHVEQFDGTWWLIDPEGWSFFAIGTDHANYNVHWCEKLGYAPYHRNVEKKYGTEKAWADTTLARLEEWGFNSLGTNASRSLHYRGLPHTEFLGMGTNYAARDPITAKTTWTGFPNVFSPDFPRFCDKEARRLCAPHRDDPWLLGYFIDNELEWHPWTGKGPFADAFAKPADHSAKAALVAFLEERHRTIGGFNAAWKAQVASFDELARATASPDVRTDGARADVEAFVRLIAERYFVVTTDAIRKHDPNHLVLGCRFAGQAPNIADIVGKYCDVVSVNFYRNVDLARGVMADGFEKDLATWYARTGRPMIITEWSFPALDAGLPCKHGAGQRVPTQVERSFAYAVFQKILFATPFMVGSNFFMWADEPALGISSTFPEDSNYGLVNEQDEPYALLTATARELHPLVYRLHTGAGTDLTIERAGVPGAFLLTNEGRGDGAYTVTTTVDGSAREQTMFLAAGTSREIRAPAGALAEPGAHVVTCAAVPANRFLERTLEKKRAADTVYVPGMRWHGRAPSRVPVVVVNDSAGTLVNVPVAVSARGIGEPVAAVDARTGAPVPCQRDRLEGGDEIALRVDAIEPHAAALVFLYVGGDAPRAAAPAVRWRSDGVTFEADNGALKLARSDPAGGAAIESVRLADLEIGRFSQLMWQDVGRNMWTAPERIERVASSAGPVRLVFDVTAVRAPSADGAGAKAFRTSYRFTLYPERTWFESRLLWVENTDTDAWKLHAYYHYTPSAIGGDGADDATGGAYWRDEAANACYGIVAKDPGVGVMFWKDGNNGQHPDASRTLDVELAPGARHAAAEPTVYVLACRGESWQTAAGRLEALNAVRVEVREAERRK